MDSNFRFPDAPSGRSAEARTFSSDREFAPLAGRTGISNLGPLAGWISALERGRFQGHKQKRKLKSVAPFARNRKFESSSLQRGVSNELYRAQAPDADWLAQHVLADRRNADHVSEECTTCSGRDRPLR